jgi:PII-like signaling protein
MSDCCCLRIYVAEAARHQGKLVYEWLLDQAQTLGIAGGLAIRAAAGFGRHGRHDSGFFELAGEVPMVVEFFVDPAQADSLLNQAGVAGLTLFYARLPATTGVTA